MLEEPPAGRVARALTTSSPQRTGIAMNLLDALELLKRPIPEAASTQEILLECGFTPLHLKTFLAAHLRQCFPKDHIEMRTGLFGDLAGNLERAQPSGRSVVCVVIEWSDLDPRLGIRSLGGWGSRRSRYSRIGAPAKRTTDSAHETVSRPGAHLREHADASLAAHFHDKRRTSP